MRRWKFLSLVLITLAAYSVIAWIAQGAFDPWITLQRHTTSNLTPYEDDNQQAPEFTLPDLGHVERHLSDFQGQYVLLNFWASYCPYCRLEMPMLETFHQEYEDLIVVGINTGEARQSIQDFVEKADVSYPILIDKTGQVTTSYRVISLPATFLLNPTGAIVWHKFGFVKEQELSKVYGQWLQSF